MKKAFTLIELLIVVAIIAILAAIAVPNFLEAQVRSKVSRAKSDMRTVSVGIEAYAIDNNKYPTDGSSSNWPHPAANDPSVNQTLGYELTTPLQYLSSMKLALDVFKLSRKDLTALGTPETDFNGRVRYIYTNYGNMKDGSGASGEKLHGAWRLICAGPDQYVFCLAATGTKQDFGDWTYMVYDATNGTVSWGDIFRDQAMNKRK